MGKQVRRRDGADVSAQSGCAEHSGLFDGASEGRKARSALGTHVADVDRLHALQERSIEDGHAATEQCRQARHTLRTAAKAVVMVGRVVNVAVPMMGTMRLPGGASDDELLAYSRGLLKRVAVHAKAFVAEGLPPDLLTRLGDGTRESEAAQEARASSRQRFSAASESILETLNQADKVVDVLEAIVLTTPAAPPEILAKLSIARALGPRVSAPEPKPPQATPTDKAA